MVTNPTGDNSSDLWISLDEAVLCTGVSRRNIQEWVSSGQVKREKRKGKIFVWVADLANLTPMTRVDPEEIQTPQPEVLSPAIRDGFSAGASYKVVSERLKENLQIQQQILQRLDEVQGSISKVGDTSTEPLLDERTVKELSLLGNVFRSLHQQNEKISKSLDGQEALLRKLELNGSREETWTQRWVNTERKLGRWRLMTISLVVMGLALGLLIWQEAATRMDQWDQNQAQNNVEKSNLLDALDGQKRQLLQKEQDMKEAERLAALEMSKRLAEVEEKMLQESRIQQERLLKEIADKESLLALLKEKEEERLKHLETRHTEELQRMEQSQAQAMKHLSDSISALKDQVSGANHR